LNDPVIVHEPTKDWALPEEHSIYDDVRLARLRQNMETPLDERIEMATWPETLAYFSTASMDSRHANGEFEKVYRHSFREYLDRWTSLEPDEQPEPLCDDPELDEYRLDKLDTLGFGIKKDRDKDFVENVYDELDIDGVPKSFWVNPYELEEPDEGTDEYSQSALEDF